MKKSFSKKNRIILSMIISILFLVNNVLTVFAGTTNSTSEIIGATISGTVTAPDGTALPSLNNGYVNIQEQNGSYNSSASIHDGKFSIVAPSDGNYNIRAYPNGDSLYALSAIKVITIKAGAVTPATDANLELRFTMPQITGTVKNEDGSTATSVYVYLRSQKMGLSVGVDNGQFKIGGLSDDTYDILACPYGDNSYANSVTKTIIIKNGEVAPSNDATLELRLTIPQIIGTVKNPDGLEPASGYNGSVNIQKQGGAYNDSVGIYNGKFNIGVLSDGDYTIKAVPASDSTYTQSAPKSFTIKDGAVTIATDKNIELRFTSPQIVGTVKVSDGTGLASGNSGHVDIQLQNSNFNTSANIYDGKFCIGGLSDGTYILQAYPNGNLPYTPSIKKTITINGGSVIPTIDKNIEFEFISPQISGIVKAPDGSDLASGNNGYVSIQLQNTGFSNSVGIYNGKFYISGLLDGTYNLKAWPESGSSFTPSVTKTITIKGGAVIPVIDKNIEFQFINPQISGTVTAPDGTALPSGHSGNIYIQTQDGYSSSSVNIYDGKFNIAGLSDGIYNIVAKPYSDNVYTQSMSRTITIVSGAVTPATDKDIKLKFTNPQITGTVAAPDGTALTSENNGYINIQAQNSYSSNSIDISNGKFNIGGLSDGTYNIYASPSSGSPYMKSITKTIIIQNGAVTPVTDKNIELKFTSPQIEGTVVAPDGTAITSEYSGNVNIQTQDGNSINSESIYNGKFYIGGLSDGIYNLKASPSFNSPYTKSMSRTITIENGAVTPITDATLELKFTNPQTVVTVKAPDGTALALGYSGSIKIEAPAQNSMSWESIYDGKFNMGGYEDGTYIITAYSNNNEFKPSQPKTITIKNGDVTPSTDAILELRFTGPQITGIVKDSNGSLATSGNVNLYSHDGFLVSNIAINEGKFTIDGLEDGSYTIKAYPLTTSNQYPSKAKTITIIDGAVTPITDSIVELQFAGPQVTGTVKAQNGAGLAIGNNGFVEIDAQSGSFNSSINIIDGKFTIGGLEDGNYTIKAYSNKPDQYPSKSKTITITAGAVTPTIDGVVELQFTGPQITGTVKDSSGTELATGYNGFVEIHTQNGSFHNLVNIIGGKFTINGLSDGSYKIIAYSNIYGQYPSKTKTITITDGEVTPTTDSILELQFTGPQITGTVKAPNGNELPIGYNGFVTIQSQNGIFSSSVDIFDGKFRIDSLNDGVYTIKASPLATTSNQYPSKTKTITITDGEVTPASDSILELQFAGPQITGTVKNSNGEVATLGHVEISAPNGSYGTILVIDSNGKFNIGGLSDGTYTIKAYSTIANQYPSKTKTITISNGEVTPAADSILELQFAGPQITGTVKNSNGALATLGHVEISMSNGPYGSIAVIDSNGKFNIGGLSDGTYTIKAYSTITNEYPSKTKIITIVDSAVTPTTDSILDLQFTGPQITGTVKNSNGTSATSGQVEIKTSNGLSVPGTGIDVNGKFNIGGLSDGVYTVKAYSTIANQYPSKTKIITIVDGAVKPTTDSILELQFTAVQITGTVKNSDGTVATSGQVEIRTSNGLYVPGTGIDINGKFNIGGLSDGVYTIKATSYISGEYPSKTKTITILDGVVTPTTDSIVELQLCGPQITGTVKSTDGAKLPIGYNGYVNIMRQNDSFNSSISIIDGKFIVGGLEDGVYTIKAYPNIANRYPSKTKTITITDSVVTPIIDSILELQFTTVQMTGTVKAPNGTELAVGSNGYISILTQDGKLYTTASILDGRFTVGGLDDGVYTIKASSYVSNQYPSKAKTITITDGIVTPTTDSILELQFTGPQITGTVKNSDGTAATSGSVEVRTSAGSYAVGTVIDNNGNFSLGGLSDGTYNLKATLNSQGSYTQTMTKTIIIKNEVVTPVTDSILELQFANIQISGTVKAENGTAVTYSYVEIRATKGVYTAGTSTDANGKFNIGSIPDGTYTVKATISTQDSYTQTNIKTITIINGAVTPTTDAIIELQFTGIQITGTVKAPDGVDVTLGYNGYVIINAQNGSFNTSVDIGAGNFKIGGLEDGIYTLKAYSSTSNQYPSKTKTITITNGEATPTTDAIVELRFTTVQITGTVKDPDGTAANSGYVEVRTLNGVSEAGGMINIDGSFNIGGLSDGTYIIKAMPNTESSFTQSMVEVITIKDGAVTPATDVPLILQFTNPQITGIMKASDGTLLTSGYNGYISIQPQNGGPSSAVKIFNGKFNIGGLTDGSYNLQAKTGDAYNEGTTKPGGNSLDGLQLHSLIKTITIKGGEVIPVSDNTLELQFINTQILGTVKAPGGTLVALGYIKVKTLDLGYESDAIIDNNGNFYIGGLSDGTYTITAYPKDNSLYSSSITKTITIKDGKLTIPSDAILELSFFEKGNIDKNGIIDMSDLTTEATHYGETTTVSNEYDINGDGVVDIFDLIIISKKIK